VRGARLGGALLLLGWCGCLSAPSGPGDAGGTEGDDARPAVDGGEERCEQIFGEAPDYQLCRVHQDGCEFFSDHVGTCAEVCGMAGAECLRSYDADSSAACTPETGDERCGAHHESQICVCAFPPGP